MFVGSNIKKKKKIPGYVYFYDFFCLSVIFKNNNSKLLYS